MRHKKKGRQLGRNTNQRKALFKGLIEALIAHGEIKTTIAKAKSIKPLVEKLVGKAKDGTLHARRQILSFLPSKKNANKLVDEIAPQFTKRISGFVRIVRLGTRQGDNTQLAKVEWTDKVVKKSDAEKTKPSIKQKLIEKKTARERE